MSVSASNTTAAQVEWRVCAWVCLTACLLFMQGPYPTEDAVDADLINAGESSNIGFPPPAK